jgi:serine/threonine protein kinase
MLRHTMTLNAVEPIAVGTRVADAFEVLRPIGQGGAGPLWEAQDLKQSQRVALLVPAVGPAAPDAALRFAQVALAAAKTGHPGIAQVLAADTLPSGAPILVLEALPGETLATKLAKGPLTLDTALRVGREVASALAAAHREQVFHADLTPESVVLCPRDGTTEQVKVVCFGVSAVRAPGPATAAPEQLQAGAAADGRTDEFALALVVYEMLAGAPLARGPAEPSFEALKWLPERVTTSLRRALAQDRGQRYPDVVAFMAECSGRAVVQGEGDVVRFAEIEDEATVLKPPEVRAPGAPAPESVAAPPPLPLLEPQRSRAGRVAAALAAALVLAGLGWLALRPGPKPAPEPSPAAAAQPDAGP